MEKFKIVMIGESGVGKTSIVNRLVNGSFENEEPTIGVSNSTKFFQTPNGDVELCIWDTAGQEMFHSLVPLYARSAAFCILVCSVDNKESLKSISHWVNIIEESCKSKPPIVVALNKIDLEESENISLDDLKKCCTTEVVNVFRCSAKTGEEIDNMFQFVALQVSMKDDEKKSNVKTENKQSCSC